MSVRLFRDILLQTVLAAAAAGAAAEDDEDDDGPTLRCCGANICQV